MKKFKELQKKMAQLERENEIYKNYRHIRMKTLNEIATFITEYHHLYPTKIMCKIFGLRRSTYYKNVIETSHIEKLRQKNHIIEEKF